LAQLAPEEAPTLLHMPDQRLRFVLRQQRYAPDVRVDAIRQSEIARPMVAAERYGRLRPPLRQAFQSRPAPSRQDQSQSLAASARGRTAAVLHTGESSCAYLRRSAAVAIGRL